VAVAVLGQVAVGGVVQVSAREVEEAEQVSRKASVSSPPRIAA